jgi:hypothetical protein
VKTPLVENEERELRRGINPEGIEEWIVSRQGSPKGTSPKHREKRKLPVLADLHRDSLENS